MNSFKILSKIGEGTYSTVYIVKRYEDGEIYSLKKVKMKNLSYKEKINALNEVRILAAVKSDFVISYKESFIDESDQTLCLVMEYADDGDLFQKVTLYNKMHTNFSEEEVWKIFIQITKGLADLHKYGILHRDLKSANVFLFKDGKAKLGDLNVSKIASRGLGCTQTGTPYYASPEIWRDIPYDLKSDIWSLGCIAYELTMLKTPFRAQTMDGLYKKVMKGEYPKINKRYSEKLGEVIGRLLKVKVEERPNTTQILSMPEVKDKIEELNIFKTPNVYKGVNNKSLIKEISTSNISSNRDNVYITNNSKITYNISNSNLLNSSPSQGDIFINKSCVLGTNDGYAALKMKYNLNDKEMEILNILDKNAKEFVSLQNEEKSIDLGTIRIPRKLAHLNNRLPESKYTKNLIKNFRAKSNFLRNLGRNLPKIKVSYSNFNNEKEGEHKVSKSTDKSQKYRYRGPSFNTLKMRVHKSRPFNRNGKIDIIVEEEEEGDLELSKIKKVKSLNLMKNVNNIYGTYCPKIYKISNGELKLNLNDEIILGNLNYSMNTGLMKGAENLKLNYNKLFDGYNATEPINLLPIIRYKNV